MAKNKFIIIILFSLFLLSGAAFAQEAKTDNAGAIPSYETDNCLKYYKMDSVRMTVQPSAKDYSVGQTVSFSGVLENTNQFPVTGGNIVVQIYRLNPEDQRVRYLLDEFVLEKNFNLIPESKVDFDFRWQVPNGLNSGAYAAAASLVLDKKIYMVGLPFSDAYAGTYAFFNIRNSGDVREVYVDKANVKLNGKTISPTSSMPYVEKDKDVAIGYVLVNSGKDSQKVRVTKHIYNWDQLQSERGQAIVEEKEVPGAGTMEISDKISGLGEGVYVYSVEVVGQGGAKSIFRLRFGMGGKGPQAKVAFLALEKFPVSKDAASYIVGCFHSTSYEKPFKGKVYITLKDKDNNIIERVDYGGEISPLVMALRRDFVFSNNYDELKLESQVYDKNGNLVDRVELIYNCDAFKDQPDSLAISVEKGGLIKVKLLNKCNSAAKANVAVEVLDDKGKVVFYDPGYVTQEYAKKAKFKYNNHYKITAQAGGVTRSIEYTHMEKDYTWAWILGAVLSAILIAAYFAWRAKKQQPL